MATEDVAVVHDGEGEGETPNPEPDQELARWLAQANIQGAPVDPMTRRCQEIIAKIVRRPDWGEEMDDILAHAEMRGLGAGWVIERMSDLASISPNTRRGFRWRNVATAHKEATYA